MQPHLLRWNAVTYKIGQWSEFSRKTSLAEIRAQINTARDTFVESVESKGVRRGGAKGAMPPPDEFDFILSKSRFRDRSSSFVENPKGTTFGKKIWPPLKQNPAYAGG